MEEAVRIKGRQNGNHGRISPKEYSGNINNGKKCKEKSHGNTSLCMEHGARRLEHGSIKISELQGALKIGDSPTENFKPVQHGIQGRVIDQIPLI